MKSLHSKMTLWLLITLPLALASPAAANEVMIDVPALSRCMNQIDNRPFEIWHGELWESRSQGGTGFRSGYFLLTKSRLRFFEDPVGDAPDMRLGYVDISDSDGAPPLIFNRIGWSTHPLFVRKGDLTLQPTEEFSIDRFPRGKVVTGSLDSMTDLMSHLKAGTHTALFGNKPGAQAKLRACLGTRISAFTGSLKDMRIRVVAPFDDFVARQLAAVSTRGHKPTSPESAPTASALKHAPVSRNAAQ